MSDLYLRRKNPQPLRATLPRYYPKGKRRTILSSYYSELSRREISEPIRLELPPNLPTSYEIVVAELESTRRQLQSVSARLSKVESRVPEQIEVRDLPLKEVKKLVKTFLKRYLEENKRVYPSDVADALCLDYESVRKVFDALEKDGQLRKE
ncbi:hypothetical protein MUP77_22275 [Candidatus Bathyarchaeota archaeon]|nr:hypothetical protein [Candidatus Bathyarchaeota archaeon]